MHNLVPRPIPKGDEQQFTAPCPDCGNDANWVQRSMFDVASILDSEISPFNNSYEINCEAC